MGPSLGHSTWISFSCDLSISLSLSHRVSFGLNVAEAEVEERLRPRLQLLLQCMQKMLEYLQQEKHWNRSDASTDQAGTDSYRLSDWSENPLM